MTDRQYPSARGTNPETSRQAGGSRARRLERPISSASHKYFTLVCRLSRQSVGDATLSAAPGIRFGQSASIRRIGGRHGRRPVASAALRSLGVALPWCIVVILVKSGFVLAVILRFVVARYDAMRVVILGSSGRVRSGACRGRKRRCALRARDAILNFA